MQGKCLQTSALPITLFFVPLGFEPSSISSYAFCLATLFTQPYRPYLWTVNYWHKRHVHGATAILSSLASRHRNWQHSPSICSHSQFGGRQEIAKQRVRRPSRQVHSMQGSWSGLYGAPSDTLTPLWSIHPSSVTPPSPSAPPSSGSPPSITHEIYLFKQNTYTYTILQLILNL